MHMPCYYEAVDGPVCTNADLVQAFKEASGSLAPAGRRVIRDLTDSVFYAAKQAKLCGVRSDTHEPPDRKRETLESYYRHRVLCGALVNALSALLKGDSEKPLHPWAPVFEDVWGLTLREESGPNTWSRGSHYVSVFLSFLGAQDGMLIR